MHREGTRGEKLHHRALLTTVLDESEWYTSRHERLDSGERVRGTHLIGGWLGGTQFLYEPIAEHKAIFSLPGIETIFLFSQALA